MNGVPDYGESELTLDEVVELALALSPHCAADNSESRVSKHERHQDMLAEHAEEKIRRRERHRSGRRAYIPIHLI